MRKESELKVRKAASAPREGKKSHPHTGFTPPLTLRMAAAGMQVERYFTRPGVDPFDEVEWDLRDAVISNEKGAIVFEQRGVEVPKCWSQTATNVVASKYFRGTLGTPQRERSVKQLIGRVVRTIGAWGRGQGYFDSEADAQAYEAELKHLLVYQKMSFNSPVWFNVGVEPKPQCSACFINSVEDTMESILGLARTEGMLFKYGSGTGSNLSPIRSSKELLAGGGTASGPVSFMKGYDAFAGVIKSGGKTRRAAKMVILNIDHPDVVEFIRCKEEEEKKAWALIDAGYGSALDGPAYSSVFFQNSNNSVRVTDEFMQAVLEDRDFSTRAVTSGEPVETFKARDLMRTIAEATWACGDPGMQFDTTINDWHPCPNTARINASNPCVTGDTLVATAEGLAPIRDLVGKGMVEIIGQEGEPVPVTEIFRTGVKPVFELRTRAGYTLKVTREHPIWTSNRGDVPAGELKTGDTLVLMPGRFGKETLPNRMAEFIGMAVGDGCKTGDQGQVFVTMGAHEEPILAEYVEYLNAVKPDRKISGVTRTPTGVRLATSAQEVVAHVDRYAVLHAGSGGKRLTDAAFRLNRDGAAALLRGLFTADGTVGFSEDKNAYVSLDSTSLALLRQVQQLLLQFGMKAKIYENRRGGRTTADLPDGKGGTRTYDVQEMHSLRVSRNSRLLFERWIGFHPASDKAARLKELNASVAAYNDPLTDPFESFEPLGREEEVFDLLEPRTHHFVAGGLVVHNCSEYMFLDDSACNLASLNLMKLTTSEGELDVPALKRAIDTTITAQEIIVDNASYPTERIGTNSHEYRPLGLGYANLGGLLMSRGLAYDSDAGRDYAAAITAVLTGEAYAQSARLAETMGPFIGYEKNREPFLRVIKKHGSHVAKIDPAHVPLDLYQAARDCWDEAHALGKKHGIRNAQATVIAPTGTIAFMMDCDTTGIEPDIALVKYKKLVGGGLLKIVNQTVPRALDRLGYSDSQVKEIMEFIDENETIEGAPHLKDAHLSVFDCAFRPLHGSRSIKYMGHLKMMGATQPFVSGAISKTVNVPSDVTVEEITEAFVESWKLGLKAVAIYRDGCKRSQPLSTSKDQAKSRLDAAVAEAVAAAPSRAVRKRLPDERRSITHKFSIAGHDGYITVGMYEEGQPGEIFLVMAKEGSVVSGLMDSFATAVSMALQYGVPLQVLVDKFSHVRFEPSGFTNNQEIPIAKSIVDYIFRWLASKFLARDQQEAIGIHVKTDAMALEGGPAPGPTGSGPLPVNFVPGPGGTRPPSVGAAALDINRPPLAFHPDEDAPPCPDCGSIMVRNAACYKCLNCGATSGCS
jgi:ribonucleoside-diphosphate reductase alpha chain